MIGGGIVAQRLQRTAADIDTIETAVSYALNVANVENVTLTETGDTSATGDGGANMLTGNSENNTLDGWTGADTMIGGAGDDIYVVDNAGDVVVEAVGEGNDTIKASVSYVLGAGSEIETARLIGTANVDLTGNELHQVLIGNAGNNVLDCGGGGDRMKGGAGDDTYIVRSAADTIVEIAGDGDDTVKAAVSYTLGASAQIEHLCTRGANATTAIDLTGNCASPALVVGRIGGCSPPVLASVRPPAFRYYPGPSSPLCRTAGRRC